MGLQTSLAGTTDLEQFHFTIVREHPRIIQTFLDVANWQGSVHVTEQVLEWLHTFVQGLPLSVLHEVIGFGFLEVMLRLL